MQKKLVLVPLLAALGACAQSGGRSGDVVQIDAKGPIAETVNGIAVPQSLLEAVAHQHNLHLDQPAQREQALTLTADMVLVAQAAQHEKYTSNESFQAAVEAARLKGIADASFAEFEKTAPITDDMLKVEYDAQTAKAGDRVYDFGQLLFNDEADALKAEGDLVGGKPFSDVFDMYRGKAKQAKVFSRVRLDQLPEPLATALKSLKNGESTKTPVKTDYGYHVVHLDISNPYTPPPFEQVKDGIRRTMQLKLSQDRMRKMHESAKIEYPAGSAPPVATPAPEKKG